MMRDWKINPELLCNTHLLGNHVELHMFAGCIEKGKSIKGYIETGLVEIHNLKNRHDEIVQEMIARNMEHKSPFPDIELYKAGEIDIDENIKELMNRCEYCRRRVLNWEIKTNLS